MPQLVEFPHALPGCCRMCGSGDTENSNKVPYIDMEYSEEFYGAVYFCNECAQCLCLLLGYVPANTSKERSKWSQEIVEVVQIVEAELRNLELNLVRVRKEIDNLRGGSLFNGNGNDPGIYVGHSGIPSSSDYRLPISLEGTGTNSPRGEEELGDREGKAVEPNDDKGLGKLRSTEQQDSNPLSF